MEVERRIAKNASMLLGASVLAQLANFVFVIYLARAFGPRTFGIYAFSLALGAVLQQFVNLGVDKYLLKQVSHDTRQWRTVVGLILPVQIALATLIWLSVILVLVLLDTGYTEVRIVAAVVAFQLIMPIQVIYSIGFTAAERMQYFALADAGTRVLIMVFGFIGIRSGFDIEIVLMIMPVSGLFVALVLAVLAGLEFGQPAFRIHVLELSKVWRQALPFFGIALLSMVYLRAGVLSLSAIGGPEQVGLYASGERLLMVAGILYLTFGQAIFPALVKLEHGDRRKFQLLANRCVRLMLLIALPLASLFYIFSKDIIDLLFGDLYLEAGTVLRIAAWAVVFRSITVVLEAICIASERKKLVFVARFVGLIFLLSVCFGVLPSMGAVGLAIAVLVSEASVLTTICIGLRSTGYLPSILKPTVPVLAACAITVLIAMMTAGFDLWIRAAIVFLSGASLLWLLGAIRIADIEFAWRLLSPSASRNNP